MTPRTFSLSADPCLADHALEGTPVVPFALIACELLAATGGNALADLEIREALLLRRGREKPVTMTHEADGSLLLLDAAGRILAAARAHPAADMNALPPLPPPPAGGARPGEAAYGPLFFHGPAFRADWRDLSVGPDRLAATLRADPDRAPFARYPWNRARPVLALDLAAQAAGMLLIAARGIYALPAGCARLALAAPGPGPFSVAARLDGDDTLEVAMDDAGRRPFLRLEGFRFRPLPRPLSADAAAFRDRFLAPGRETP